MYRLLINQLYYFYFLIEKKFYFWIILILFCVSFLGLNFRNNPNINLLTLLFGGIPFENIKTPPIELPVFWFFYLLVPILIIGDSFNEIWKNRIELFRGLNFSRTHFFLVNQSILFLFYIFFVGITFGFIFFTTKIGNIHVEFSASYIIYILFNLLFLTNIYFIISMYSSVLGVLSIIFILIFTAYTNVFINPLNLTMLSRLNFLNIKLEVIILLILILALNFVYWIKLRKIEIY